MDIKTLGQSYPFNPLVMREKVVSDKLKDIEAELPIVDNTTYVGIEIEIEDIYHLQNVENLKPIWTHKEDGSLRNNGMEFVSNPVKGSNIQKALEQLYRYFDEYHRGCSFSERTGIHVHINARDIKIPNLVTFISLYSILEECLFDFAGRHRAENLFCVPLNSTATLKEALKGKNKQQFGDWLYAILHSSDKYSALNIKTLFTFGTFEFRHLDGTHDWKKIYTWIRLLLSIKKYATTHTTDALYEDIKKLNTTSEYDKFLISIFGEDFLYIKECSDYFRQLEKGIIHFKSNYCENQLKVRLEPSSKLYDKLVNNMYLIRKIELGRAAVGFDPVNVIFDELNREVDEDLFIPEDEEQQEE